MKKGAAHSTTEGLPHPLLSFVIPTHPTETPLRTLKYALGTCTLKYALPTIALPLLLAEAKCIVGYRDSPSPPQTGLVQPGASPLLGASLGLDEYLDRK